MTASIQTLSLLVSFEKIPVTIFQKADEACKAVAVEMAVPMSPEQLLKKRYGIFKHQSQKDGVVFQGTDSREFWQRAEERNGATAMLYNKLGLAE